MKSSTDGPIETFYVVGNGPSLTRRILAALPTGRWLGMNSAYRLWEETHHYPRIYACVDPVVGKSQSQGIARLIDRPEVHTLLLHEDIRETLPHKLWSCEKIVWRDEFVSQPGSAPAFSALAEQKQTTGALATRFAIAQGFTRIRLLGIDCRFVEVIDEAESVGGIELLISKQPSHNPNYFFSGYQGVGDSFQEPNPAVHSGNLHLQSFVALRNDIEVARREDIRITVGSLESLLAQHGVFDYEAPHADLRIRRLGAVAVPLMAREVPQLVENLKQWSDSRTAPTLRPDLRGTSLHLIFSDLPQPQDLDLVQRTLDELPALQASFDAVHVTVLPIPDDLNHYVRDASATRSSSTKSGPNCAFLSGMAQMEDCDYTLYIETDCVPIRFGWLDAAERSIQRAGEDSWIIGAGYFGPMRLNRQYRYHLNGNAIYKTGDAKFRLFLEQTFMPTLRHFLAAGIRDLAYDTTLSLAYDSIETLPDKLAQALQSALPRFSFTDLILNVGGTMETKNPDLVPMTKILSASDGTFFLHGRAAITLAARHRDRLKESYSLPADNAPGRLALYWASTSRPGWQGAVEGYGRVAFHKGADSAALAESANNDLVVLHFSRVHRNTQIARAFAGAMVTDVWLATLPSINLVFLTERGFVSRHPCQVSFDTGSSHCRLEFLVVVPDLGAATKVNLEIGLLSAHMAASSLSEVELVERPAGQGSRGLLSLVKVDPNQSCLLAVAAWRACLEELDSLRAASQMPKLTDWESALYALKEVQLESSSVRLALERSSFIPTAQHSSPVARAVVADCSLHSAASFDVVVERRPDAPAGVRMMIRVCRHGSTPWEYHDLHLRLDGPRTEMRGLPIPFRGAHDAYRIEVHAADAVPLRENFELIVRWHAKAEPVATSLSERRDLDVEAPLHTRRVLIIDPTQLGASSATGQLKSVLFGRWPTLQLRQVWDPHVGDGNLAFGPPQGETSWPMLDSDSDRLLSLCREFEPEVIYVRPTDDLKFNEVACTLLAGLRAPAVIHIMDDWMERARRESPQTFAAIAAKLDWLVDRCSVHLSICEGMSSMLGFRYGHEWSAVANGVRSQDSGRWPAERPAGKAFTIRYMGGLAEDMCWSTVDAVARVVQAMSRRFAIRFEVYTMSWYLDGARQAWADLDAVQVDKLVAAPDYAQALTSADALLVAYNFDERSIAYTRYSMSNKLPECLASGAPVLAVGPADICTISELATAEDACVVVTSASPREIERAIVRMMSDESWQSRRPAAVRQLLEQKFNLDTMLSVFDRAMAQAVDSGAGTAAKALAKLSFAKANDLFRQGQTHQAFRAYIALYRQQPLEMYRQNAELCMARAGLDRGSFDHAMRSWSPVKEGHDGP